MLKNVFPSFTNNQENIIIIYLELGNSEFRAYALIRQI